MDLEKAGMELNRPCKYAAFVSYTHAGPDMRIAARIQRQLERFRIPRKIRQETGRRQIGRIFRDKEELALTSDLSERIRDALEQSEFLIVICSPRALESAWVAKEIRLFRELHGTDRILTVLAEGEPGEVIPAELLAEGAEVLSCDYRLPARTAKREELPRLAAALVGCSYDDLRQRQRQYRARRNGWIAACAAAAFACVTGYLSWNNLRIRAMLRETQTEQSRLLARNSMEALESGDRIEAVRLALQALPKDGDDRPEIPEAVHALEESLDAYVPEGTFHISAMRAFAQEQDLRQFLTSSDGRCLAACTDKVLTVWDAESGNVLCERPFLSARDPARCAFPISDGGDGFLAGDGLVLADIGFSDGALRWQVKLPDEEEQSIRGIALVPGSEEGDVLAVTAEAAYIISGKEHKITRKLLGTQISQENRHERFLPSYSVTQDGAAAPDKLLPRPVFAQEGTQVWLCAGISGLAYHFSNLVCWDIEANTYRTIQPEQAFTEGQNLLVTGEGQIYLAGYTDGTGHVRNTAGRTTLSSPVTEHRSTGIITVVKVDGETGKTIWKQDFSYTGQLESGVRMGEDGGRVILCVSEDCCILDPETGMTEQAFRFSSEILALFGRTGGKMTATSADSAGSTANNGEDSHADSTANNGDDSHAGNTSDSGSASHADSSTSGLISCFLRDGALGTGSLRDGSAEVVRGFVDSGRCVSMISAEDAYCGHQMWYLMADDRIIQYQLGSGNPDVQVYAGAAEKSTIDQRAPLLADADGILIETYEGTAEKPYISWFSNETQTCVWQWEKPDQSSTTFLGRTEDGKQIVLGNQYLQNGAQQWQLVLLNVEDGAAQYVKLPMESRAASPDGGQQIEADGGRQKTAADDRDEASAPDSGQKTVAEDSDEASVPDGDGQAGAAETSAGRQRPSIFEGMQENFGSQILAMSRMQGNKVAYAFYDNQRIWLSVYDIRTGEAKIVRAADQAGTCETLLMSEDGAHVLMLLSTVQPGAARGSLWLSISPESGEVISCPFTFDVSANVHVSADGRTIAACSADQGEIQVTSWQGDSVRTTGRLPYAPADLFVRDGQLFALERDGTVHRYDLNTLVETAEIPTIDFSGKVSQVYAGWYQEDSTAEWEISGSELWVLCENELAVLDLDSGHLRTSVHDCLGYTPDHSLFYVIAGENATLPGVIPHYSADELVRMGLQL